MASRGLCAVICNSFSALGHTKICGAASMLEFRPFLSVFHLDMSLMTPESRPLSFLTESLFDQVVSKLEGFTLNRGCTALVVAWMGSADPTPNVGPREGRAFRHRSG